MSTPLERQQDALLQALWQPTHEQAIGLASAQGALADRAGDSQWQRGIRAYRSNAHELARRALAGAYPVIEQLLGEDDFTALAQSLWAAHPPRRGDVAQWGGELAGHIESLADLGAQAPYAGDVARVEWLLHRAATAADAALDTASLQLLASQDPATFTLLLAPGTACVASAWPVVSIVNAHLVGEPTMDEAGSRLREELAETALIWRQGLKPRVREAMPGEPDLVAALQESRSLADSLQSAPALDFGAWLAPAARSGLLVGVVPL